MLLLLLLVMPVFLLSFPSLALPFRSVTFSFCLASAAGHLLLLRILGPCEELLAAAALVVHFSTAHRHTPMVNIWQVRPPLFPV